MAGQMHNRFNVLTDFADVSKQGKQASQSPPAKKIKKKVPLLASSPESGGDTPKKRERIDKGKAPMDTRIKPPVKRAPKSPKVVRKLRMSESGSDKEVTDSPKVLKVVVRDEEASPPSDTDFVDTKSPSIDQLVKLW